MKTKQELAEEIWRASTLSWREAIRIVTDAMDLGRATAEWYDKL